MTLRSRIITFYGQHRLAASKEYFPEILMKKIALLLVLIFTVSAFAFAADTYLPGKIVKWDNGTYPDGKKVKTWVIYTLQADTTNYSIARKGENKPQMQAGEAVQYYTKKGTQIYVLDARNKKREYQIVGQTAAGTQAPPAQ